MKGFIKFLVLVVAVVAFVYYGKKYIDDNAMNIDNTVVESLNKYYASENVKDLEPIIKLLNKNENKEEIINKINQLAYVQIGGWYNYLTQKYACNLDNKMACEKAKADINILQTKLNQIYSQKSSGGKTIISSAVYEKIEANIEKYMSGVEQAANNSQASSPKTSREILLQKCAYAKNCKDCSSSNTKHCNCEYAGAKGTENLTCPRNIVPPEQIIDRR